MIRIVVTAILIAFSEVLFFMAWFLFVSAACCGYKPII